VRQKAPALSPRKHVAGAAASVFWRIRVFGCSVQQAGKADLGEVAAVRDARDKGDGTFPVFPLDEPHPARVFLRDLASQGDKQPLRRAVVDLIATLYNFETPNDFLDDMVLFKARFHDMVLDGKWEEALAWHSADKV